MAGRQIQHTSYVIAQLHVQLPRIDLRVTEYHVNNYIYFVSIPIYLYICLSVYMSASSLMSTKSDRATA